MNTKVKSVKAKKQFILFITALLFLSTSAVAQTTETDILGKWLDEGKTAEITIYQKGTKFYGKISWLDEPNIDGKPKTDQLNPDPARRNDPILGQELMKNFVFDGKSKWKGGTIYDAESGKTYKCYMKLKTNNELKIRGYVGIPLLGGTTVWYRK